MRARLCVRPGASCGQIKYSPARSNKTGTRAALLRLCVPVVQSARADQAPRCAGPFCIRSKLAPRLAALCSAGAGFGVLCTQLQGAAFGYFASASYPALDMGGGYIHAAHIKKDKPVML